MQLQKLAALQKARDFELPYTLAEAGRTREGGTPLASRAGSSAIGSQMSGFGGLRGQRRARRDVSRAGLEVITMCRGLKRLPHPASLQ